MVARFKADVTKRSERGFMGLTFNRVLSICGGGFVGYVLAQLLALSQILAVILVIIFLMISAYLLGEPAGTARYRVILSSWKATLMMGAYTQPESVSARICKFLSWHSATILVHSQDIFISQSIQEERFGGIEILDDDALEMGGFEIIADDEIIVNMNRIRSDGG
ncbi:MAG: hypothetical protein WBC91_19485 [Phototrophicaceae bacterium]